MMKGKILSSVANCIVNCSLIIIFTVTRLQLGSLK